MAALGGGLVAFSVVASTVHWAWSVPVGLASCLVAVWGVLDMFGTFGVTEGEASEVVELRAVLPRTAELLLWVAALVVVLRLAVAGVLPWPRLSAALLVTGGFLGCVVSTYRLGKTLGIWRDEPAPLFRRSGFWVIALTTIVYLPMLGSYSLSDPWETHYGEVAREMLARDDWLSLWWAQDGWFWSKPILDFWIQGLSFSLLGVKFMPDRMIATVADGRFPQPEWAARLPVFLMALVAAYVLYKGTARVFGQRAALLGSIVLLSTPYWYMLAHQSMTDMPYVAPLAAALGFFMLGFDTEPETRVKRYPVRVGPRVFGLSAFHLLFGLVLLATVAQSLYLLSRNITFQLDASPRGYVFHPDVFFSGSGGGNCGLPGNGDCDRVLPQVRWPQPWMMACLWLATALVLLAIELKERRAQRLYFIAAWFCVAVSAMAKGAPGLVLPLLGVLVYVGATRRWSDLQRVELLAGLLITLCVALPWFVQMYVRHGPAFTDRLFFHDMYKRAFVHVHDTNTGDDISFRYYIWQLGYGLFPWTGLCVGSLLWWAKEQSAGGESERSGNGVFLVLSFILAFSMFSVSLTKFHHYILPAIPPLAMLTGWLLHRISEHESPRDVRRWAIDLALSAVGCVLALDGIRLWFPGSLSGSVRASGPAPAAPLLGSALVVFAVVVFGILALRVRGNRDTTASISSTPGSVPALVLVALGAASLVFLAGRDQWSRFAHDVEGQIRLIHLVTYNYGRPWPRVLDFRAIFIAFTVVSTMLCAALGVSRWRKHVTDALCVLGVLWAVWAVDVYVVRTAPHWGQRETIMAYYRDRRGPDEPLVAYQMNWKGENFYTGNRIPAFVSSGAKFKDWLDDQRSRGVRTMYFVTEHSRVNGLRRELGQPKDFVALTTKALDNKFLVARVRFPAKAEPPAPTEDTADSDEEEG
ncbi:MAG: glycosyltransferase family 39 protein [Polyangiaceae bacterium]|nr:glycosyltransferase family 39 protein [Polyangiaceae bacterium]